MDHPDKKRAQMTNVEPAAPPPSQRRQPSSAGVGSDQQSAAASAHPTAMAAAAVAPTAAQAVAASPTPTDPAVAVSAASRLSPAERCPSDPLSVALSFLGARNFAVASRVCRHWQRTTELQSAWPEFSVERLISGLVEDERHWAQSRWVHANAYYFGAGALERLTQSPKWRRLSELYLDGYTNESVSLAPVLQLPHLQSLHVSGISLDNVAAAFSVGSRLQALCCSGQWDNRAVQPHLHLLANLRVLVVSNTIDAQALLSLHQLEFLQLRHFTGDGRNLLLAIRRLSVQHRLRHVSLSSRAGFSLDLNPLVAELSGADSDLAPAALVSVRLFCVPANAPSSTLLSLPNLTRLHWGSKEPIGTADEHGHSLPPSPLRRLRLNWQSSDVVALARLLQRVAARAPQLQELSLGFGRLPWGPESLQRLRSLRVLEVSVCALPLSLVRMLAALPLFSELIFQEERSYHPDVQLTVDTLRCIAESRSWRLIRLIGCYDRPQLTLPGDVDVQLAERLANFRVQVEWHSRTTSHQLTIDADDTVTWAQTAM